MNYIHRVLSTFISYNRAGTDIFSVLLKAAYYRLRGKKILAHQHVHISGLSNIHTAGTLKIGTTEIGFMRPEDPTFFNVKGKLNVLGDFLFGRGCRVYIAKNATVNLGDGSYINPLTHLVITSGLDIGSGCAISWKCEFLDNDFHTISYESKKQDKPSQIILGNRVWVGRNVSFYKGSRVASGCVVASDSVVKGVFLEENCLLAGNPARIVRRNVTWGDAIPYENEGVDLPDLSASSFTAIGVGLLMAG